MPETRPNRYARRHPDERPSRRWASQKAAGKYAGVSDRTIRAWISEGLIRGYKVNQRVIRVDLNEVDAAMQPFGGAA